MSNFGRKDIKFIIKSWLSNFLIEPAGSASQIDFETNSCITLVVYLPKWCS